MASYDDTATVSGNIVQVNDGADELAVKNWLVTLPASLSGYSEVNGVKSGANLFNEDWEVGGLNDTTGLPNSDTNKIRSKTFSIIKGSTTCYVSVPQPIIVLFYASDESFISETANIRNNSFTVPSNCSLFKIRGTVDYGTTYNNDIMISYGSTATAYEAYTAPTVTTVSLGRTIYGGSVDVVNGTGKETHGAQSFSGSETWTLSGTSFWYTTKSNPNVKASQTITASNGVVIRYSTNGQIRCYLSDNVGVVDTSTDMNALFNSNEWFSYELATPTDFTFTPITPTPETPLGASNFWADEGDSEITYYKDGYGFTSVTVHKETPEGEPVEETRKFHRIIYEGQVDVISGTGLIYIGESGTEYDPPEEISFTPVEIATDEGENTFYADEGVSVITYRRGVE